MNRILKISMLFFALMLSLASCKKEVFTTDTDPNNPNPTITVVNGLIGRTESRTGGIELGCLTVNYPFQMLRIDSTTVTIATEAEFIAAISDSTNYLIDFVYPLNVTDEGGNQVSVTDADALGLLFANCIPTSGFGGGVGNPSSHWFPAFVINTDNSCYTLVYPLSIIAEDSSVISVANEASLISYLSDGNFYSFSFPLSLLDENGQVQTAGDEEELLDLLVDCDLGGGNPGGGNPGGGFDPGECGIGSIACYNLVYPVNLVVDGQLVTVQDENGFVNAMLTATSSFELSFPVTLQAQDSTILVIQNEQALNDAIEACFPGGGGGGITGDEDFVCYDFNFPITVIVGGNSSILNSSAEWQAFIASGTGSQVLDFGFPLTLTKVSTGAVITVNNFQELQIAVQNCW